MKDFLISIPCKIREPHGKATESNIELEVSASNYVEALELVAFTVEKLVKKLAQEEH